MFMLLKEMSIQSFLALSIKMLLILRFEKSMSIASLFELIISILLIEPEVLTKLTASSQCKLFKLMFKSSTLAL